jgi:hypothetical protein
MSHSDRGMIGVSVPHNNRIQKVEILLFVNSDTTECKTIKDSFFPDCMDVCIFIYGLTIINYSHPTYKYHH